MVKPISQLNHEMMYLYMNELNLPTYKGRTIKQTTNKATAQTKLTNYPSTPNSYPSTPTATVHPGIYQNFMGGWGRPTRHARARSGGEVRPPCVYYFLCSF